MTFDEITPVLIDRVVGEETDKLLTDPDRKRGEEKVLMSIIMLSKAAQLMADNAARCIGTESLNDIFKALVAAGIRHGWYLHTETEKTKQATDQLGLTTSLEAELEEILQGIRRERA